jgi:protoporphyrinogen oxidase
MKIAVVGGGISGLATAYYLKDFAKVDVFEKSQIGGKAHTIKKKVY